MGIQGEHITNKFLVDSILTCTGLLPLLKSIHKPKHLRDFAGQVIGVDAYGWLHRGTIACAIELAQNKPTRKHIDFTLNRVRMLIHFGVKPYLVFDGDYLPSKAHTEQGRATRRRESKKLGLDLLAAGRTHDAQLELQKAIDVTPSMARQLIESLKDMGVPYVVAPYEADAQLAYLEKQGVISGVISEDSDLLVFGVKCLLTKLDQYGECVMINRNHFTACREVSLVGWTDAQFRMMAMLNGCDYLPGLSKMGLKTAYSLVRKHKAIDRVVRAVQFDGKMKVPEGYLESFTNAERTFLYQWVFDEETKGLVTLNKVPSELDVASMPFIGAFVEPENATGVASGYLDPNTKQPLHFEHNIPQARYAYRSVSTPTMKNGKPISEFFKPKRTPLAELDPNSFAASPSQQRLQQTQARLSWPAMHVPEVESFTPDHIAPRPAPSSAPQLTRQPFPRPAESVHRSVFKRQRLCSDTTMASHMDGSVGVQAATSRFFAKRVYEASPSTRKAVRTSRRRKDEFELWSEDSAIEAVAALTEDKTADEAPATDDAKDECTVITTPSPKKRKKLGVYEDPVEVSAPVCDVQKLEVVEAAATPLQERDTNESLGQTSPTKTKLEVTSVHIIVASSPPALIIDDGASAVKGSEDLCVPDSPDSSRSEHLEVRTPSLDLGRFAFIG